jgi:hypothetical protein
MVERILPGATIASVEALRQAAEASCRALAAEGRPVRYLRSVFTPGDSRCRCLFEAASADLVRELNESAQLPYNRILLALDLRPC